MKFLKSLKSKHGLSILALAHTPKRDASKPLGRNDLQGSKMLINFCDSSFAIGESARNVGLRYLKQIKARNTEIIFHAENVLLANIVKSGNFLRFVFDRTGAEQEHLRVFTDKQREELIAKVKKLAEEGSTQKTIAEKLGISQMSVSRYLRYNSNQTGEGA
jgi:predicted XRE-type DNA-binding protein